MRTPAAALDDDAVLLQAVYDHPELDEPRLVYADWLQERGDPRGELIVLQCSKTRTAEQEARVAELVYSQSTRWLGPLAKVIAEVRYARGFPVACVAPKGPRRPLEQSVGHPAWSTIEELTFEGEMGGRGLTRPSQRVPAAPLLVDPVMRALRVVRNIDWYVLEVLLTSPRPLPFQEVAAWLGKPPFVQVGPPGSGVAVVSPRAKELLARCDALPCLRTLSLRGVGGYYQRDLAWLAGSPVVGRLEALALPNWGNPRQVLDEILPALPSSLATLDLNDCSARLRFRRDASGQFTILEVEPDPPDRQILNYLISNLNGLDPSQLTSLAVSAPRDTPAHVELLRHALERFPRLAHVTLPEVPK